MDEFVSNPVEGRQPIMLLPNRRYPTYQLYAEAVSKKVSVYSMLRIVVLITFSWLRKRFREFEIPKLMKTLPVSDYENFELSELTSFTINNGYKVEVIWLEREKAWTLQLIEPDLGSNPGVSNQVRPPVPGRLFETNISYQINGNRVLCGFKTMVSEPETTEERAEVYRLAIIRDIVQHELISLRQDWPIVQEAFTIDKNKTLDSFASWIREKNNYLPIVIAVECCRNSSSDSDNVEDSSDDNDNNYPISIDELARNKFGYALFFKLPKDKIEKFNNKTKLNVKSGDAVILPAFYDIRNGSDGFVKNHIAIIDGESKSYEELDSYIANYSREKIMEIPSVLFLYEAKQKYQETIIATSESNEEITANFLKQFEHIHQEYGNVIQEIKNQLTNAEEKFKRKQKEITNRELEFNKYKENAINQIGNYLKDIEEKDEKIDRLLLSRKRPLKINDVEKWVADSFKGRLLLHSRATDMLKKVCAKDFDLRLLCDAIEFLASEYLDHKRGLISSDEMNCRCSKIYDRPFSVEPSGEKPIERFYDDYNIKYSSGNGNPATNYTLDFHLKVGNTSDNILRIYFFYDKDNRIIVVGSLPEHLRTCNYH